MKKDWLSATKRPDHQVNQTQEEQGHGDLVDAVHDPEVDAFPFAFSEEVQWIGVVQDFTKNGHSGVDSTKRTDERGWCSIKGHCADFYTGLFW